jgi:hypothetical protein
VKGPLQVIRFRRDTFAHRQELLKVLDGHERTLAVCEACAMTTRDLALEVKRGGVPSPADLQQTIVEAERVLAELVAVREEVERLRAQLGDGPTPPR